MYRKSWLLGGLVLFVVIFAVHHPPVPTNAYWHSHSYTTNQGSSLWIAASVDHLKWDVNETYVPSIAINATSFATNVVRFYDITIECKWEANGDEVTLDSEGPYELISQYQKVNATFDFSPSRDAYGLGDDRSRDGVLYYRVNTTEDLSIGADVIWTTGWQSAFEIRIEAPESQDIMLWVAVIFLAGFGLIAMGVSRRE